MQIHRSAKKMLLVVFLSALSSAAISSEQTDRTWKQMLNLRKLPRFEQSYCYTDEAGQIQGEQQDYRIRLASVSKLGTSLWAMEKLGAEYRFDTKLFIKGNDLHIAGSMDPFLGNEKMFFLLSQLNSLGYQKFNRITFDKIIQINPDAQKQADQYPVISRESNARNLKMYFNTQNWSASMKNEYNRIARLAPAGKFQKSVEFEIFDAVYSESNPFAADPEARVLTLSSAPLYKYLKEINVQSNNYAAQTLFLKLGGETKFKEYMQQRFHFSDENIRFWSGSGLPTIINGERFDNYATCSVMIDIIGALKETAITQGKKLEDIMAVPGSDGGTFSNRIFPSDYKNAFVAKTGTLMHTSTLAGAMNTQKGLSFYGIFNQSTDIEGSKVVQNEMVKSIMTDMGGPLAFNYTVLPFFTYGTDNVKNNSIQMSVASDFIPFDHNLY